MIDILKRLIHAWFCLFLTRLNYNPSKDLLPYIDALIQELLRWSAVVPLAIPHRLIQDDEYRGRMCDFA
jgi:cytochrome P450